MLWNSAGKQQAIMSTSADLKGMNLHHYKTRDQGHRPMETEALFPMDLVWDIFSETLVISYHLFTFLSLPPSSPCMCTRTSRCICVCLHLPVCVSVFVDMPVCVWCVYTEARKGHWGSYCIILCRGFRFCPHIFHTAAALTDCATSLSLFVACFEGLLRLKTTAD